MYVLPLLLLAAAGHAHIFRTQRQPGDWIDQPFSYHHDASSSSESAEIWDFYSTVVEVDPPRSIVYQAPVTRDDSEHIFDEAYETMSHISEEAKRRIHRAFSSPRSERAGLNATQLLQSSGYGFEQHEVKTEDGYYLTLVRITGKGPQTGHKTARPAALLVHGLLGSADDWLLMGPGKSLAYQMVDAGFDVWLGSVRGSRYSRHAAKHPAQPDYWQFGIDEIAALDLPAMIDYTLAHTAQEKLFYVGHSLGATAFFAMASAYPEHGRKVAAAHALAPAVHMSHTRSPLFRMLAPTSRYYTKTRRELGNGEFQPSKRLLRAAGGRLCERVVGCEHVCSNVNFVVTGVEAAAADAEQLPVVAAHVPAGGSTRLIEQYAQAVAAGQLRKYDFGARINHRVYGQATPPAYDMSAVHVPVAIYYSEEDWLAHPADVARLRAELPDVRDFYRVPEQHFAHMDFQFSARAPAAVYRHLIAAIKGAPVPSDVTRDY